MKAYIWDLDGTILDSYAVIVPCLYKTCQEFNIAVEESCELTEDYQKNWRKDRKYRKQLSKADKKKASFDEVWKTMTNQTWDESLKSWVVTILKAPADYSVKTMKEELVKLNTPNTNVQ